MTESIMQAGIQGVQGGLDQFGRAAGHVATAVTGQQINGNSLEDNLVQIKQAQKNVEVSTKVITTADSTVGTLLDELA